jgi:hypothetical protein
VLELILRLMTTGSVLVGALAIYAAIRAHSQQLNAQIFLAYSDRLQRIRRSMRSDLLLTRAVNLDPDPEREIPVGAIETLHLIFELYELRLQGYVKGSFWAVWGRDIDRFLNAPLIRLGHNQIKVEFEGHAKFVSWIESRQTKAKVPHIPRRLK